MSTIKPWPKATGKPEAMPPPIKRPCDFGLIAACIDLETQLGTIEAYNRLVDAAKKMLARIDAGDVKPQNQIYAVRIDGSVPPNAQAQRLDCSERQRTKGESDVAPC